MLVCQYVRMCVCACVYVCVYVCVCVYEDKIRGRLQDSHISFVFSGCRCVCVCVGLYVCVCVCDRSVAGCITLTDER